MTTRKTAQSKLATVAKARVKPVKHPAQKAGESIHKTISDASDTVTETVTTGVTYAFHFLKGLVLGS